MPNPSSYSPLRYPGGKSCLTNFITGLAQLNGLKGGVYLELYAGGAGAALNLLFNGTFRHIHINDYDYSIYAMWYTILNHSKAIINLINKTPVDIEEWYRQRQIFRKGRNTDIIELGFATFYLNRTNRSGIIFKAGPIGGLQQDGNYKIDVRFNKIDLINRIKAISERRHDITLTNQDAVSTLENVKTLYSQSDDLFVYLDPPYYNKGKDLYLNNYSDENHRILSNTVRTLTNVKWMISYDNVSQIKEMYRGYRMSTFDLNYTLQNKKFGSELLIFSDDLALSDYITVKSRRSELILLNE